MGKLVKHRIALKKDFDNLRDGPSIYKKSQAFISFSKQNNFRYPRIAFSVSKKMGNAVNRNYFKRICREIFFKELSNQTLDKDILVSLNARFLKKLETRDRYIEVLKKDLSEFFKSLKS